MKVKKLYLLVVLASLTMLAIPSISANQSVYGVWIGKYPYSCGAPFSGLELYTPYEWFIRIEVYNSNPYTITNVRLKDNFGAEFAVTIMGYGGGTGGGIPEITLSGASEKVKVTWYIGDLASGESAWLDLRVETDINPGGNQEFTSCGEHYMNSGAVVKWLDDRGRQHSNEADPIVVTTY